MPHFTAWLNVAWTWWVLVPSLTFGMGVAVARVMKRAEVPFFMTFATKTIAEVTKDAVTAAVHASSVGSIVLAPLAGIVSKEFVEVLLSRTSEVERKLDKLLNEPLKTALKLLRDAAINPTSTPQEIESRDSLLDAAHHSFARALALSGDSREDELFIRALDGIALAKRSGRTSVASLYLAELDIELMDLYGKVLAVQKEAAEWSEGVNAMNRFLGRDPEDWGGKPYGYDSQVALAKWREKHAKKVAAKAASATFRYEVLQNLVILAKSSLKETEQLHR